MDKNIRNRIQAIFDNIPEILLTEEDKVFAADIRVYIDKWADKGWDKKVLVNMLTILNLVMIGGLDMDVFNKSKDKFILLCKESEFDTSDDNIKHIINRLNEAVPTNTKGQDMLRMSLEG